MLKKTEAFKWCKLCLLNKYEGIIKGKQDQQRTKSMKQKPIKQNINPPCQQLHQM